MSKFKEMQETENVQKTKLKNGLTVVTEHVENIKSVTVGVWAKTGSRDEHDAQAGITHFLEHMLFKGTENRSSAEIAMSMESVGGYLNAFTSSEYTCYYSRCLNTQLERALEVLSDMVLHPSFPKDEMEKEKKVVLEEMKMYRDRPKEYILEEFSGHLFDKHPLGRPVIGNEETVSAFQQQDLFAYMEARYQPSNLLIAIAGNVVHDEVVALANAAFGRKTDEFIPQEEPPMPAYQKGNVELTKPIEQTHFITGRRGLDYNHDDKYLLLLANTILGGGMSSRLHQNIREQYGYCYTISSFNQSYRDTGMYGIYAGTDQEYVNHVRVLIRKELDRLKQQPVSEKELDEAKAQLKGKLLLSLESMSNRMSRLGKSEIYYGRYISLDELIQEIDGVQSSELQDFAQKFYDVDLFSETSLVPSNE